MFRIPSFTKTPKNRRFEFKPRYYDAEKEAFEERVRKATAETSAGIPEADQVKIRIQQQYEKHRLKKNAYGARQSNFRIILITGLLGALIYWILK